MQDRTENSWDEVTNAAAFIVVLADLDNCEYGDRSPIHNLILEAGAAIDIP